MLKNPRLTLTRGCAVALTAVAATALASVAGPAHASGDSYSISASTGQSFVTAGPGDLFPAGADDAVTVLSTSGSGVHKLPFPITVYGGSYNRVVVSSNGNLQFTGGAGSTAYYNDCLPSGNFNYPVIAPFWDDIVIGPRTTGVSEGLFVQTRGLRPHRQFVVNWRGHHFSDGTPIRAGVIFTEGSPVFSFQYLQNDAADASIGVQRAASGPATQWACNQGASVFPGLKLRLAPQ